MILKFKTELITCIKMFIFQHIYKAPTSGKALCIYESTHLERCVEKSKHTCIEK